MKIESINTKQTNQSIDHAVKIKTNHSFPDDVVIGADCLLYTG
jgi:hypothetical protein